MASKFNDTARVWTKGVPTDAGWAPVGPPTITISDADRNALRMAGLESINERNAALTIGLTELTRRLDADRPGLMQRYQRETENLADDSRGLFDWLVAFSPSMRTAASILGNEHTYDLFRSGNLFVKALPNETRGVETTLQPGDVGPILDAKGLWGGNPFNPNGKLGDVIFSAMDQAGFRGRFDATLKISETGVVAIETTGSRRIQNALQSALGAKMTAAIRASGREVPAGGLVVTWLEGVANA